MPGTRSASIKLEVCSAKEMVIREPSGEMPKDSGTRSGSKPTSGRTVLLVSCPGTKSWTKTPQPLFHPVL